MTDNVEHELTGTSNKGATFPPQPGPPGEEGISRGAAIGVGAAVAAGAVGVGVYLATREAAPASELISHFVEGELPEKDPLASFWRSIGGFHVELQRQAIATPMLDEQSIEDVTVKSAHNGKRIVFRLQWATPGPATVEAIDRFRDAVAIQLPVDDQAAVVAFMGSRGLPVNIFHWKASWQKDVDEGFQTVKDSYPNLFEDVTPEKLLGKEKSVQFYPGLAAGNPLSSRKKTSPVEEIIAEGFGTATHADKQAATGRGVYSDGSWFVTIAFDMDRGKGLAKVTPGKRKKVAFAAWNGSAKNVGSRKQWADWQLMEVRDVG